MQKFIVDPAAVKASRVHITGQDARHMAKVLRLSPGSPVSLTDGKGTDYRGEMASISRDRVEIVILGEAESRTESPLALTVCSAMLKDKKMDGVVRHLVQLGVTRWIPFFSERSVPGPNPKQLARRVERWEIIGRESLKQCRRSCLMEITLPTDFAGVLEMTAGMDRKIAFWEGSDRPLERLRQGNCRAGMAAVLIGPEGGFSPDEIQAAETAGYAAYGLGPRILRAETAAVTAAGLVQYIMGDMGSHCPGA